MCSALDIIGTGLQVAGAISGGMAKKADAKLQAEVARMNAGVAESTAETNTVLAELPGIAAKLDAQKIMDALRVAQGAATATYSTANLDPSSGAPLLVAGVTAAQGAVDLGLTWAQAALSKASRLADAASSYAAAASDRFGVVRAENEADNAMMAAYFGAASALIGGAQTAAARGYGGGGTTPAPSIAPASYSSAPSIYSTPAYSAPIASAAFVPGGAPYANWPH